MTVVTNILDNREISVLAWLFVFCIWAIWQPKLRQAIWELMRAASQPKLLLVILPMAFYVALLALLLKQVQLWNLTLLPETTMWFLGTAVGFLMTNSSYSKQKTSFAAMIKENLVITAAVEFIVGLRSFSLVIELIMVPGLVFIAMCAAVAGLNKGHEQVKKLLDGCVALIGLIVLVATIMGIVQDIKLYLAMSSLAELLLPLILSIAMVPVLYAVLLAMSYETLFLRLKFLLNKDNDAVARAKRIVFQYCGLSIRRLDRFANAIAVPITMSPTNEKALNAITEIAQKVKVRT